MKYLRCELHTHTLFSDGSMSPAELADEAKKRGYDLIVVSDHNNIFGRDAVKRRGKEIGLYVIGAIEWTTFWGHLIASGGNSKVDWRDITPQNINDKIIEAVASGDAITLCHPKRVGDPICYGCHNDFEITAWDKLTAYEVWTRPNPENMPMNLMAKTEWKGLLDKGYKIAAVYGYDWHSPDYGCPPYAVTYVGISGEPNEKSFVSAIKGRHTYISMGVELDACIVSGGKRYEIGDDIPAGMVTIYANASVYRPYSAIYPIVIEQIKVTGTVLEYCTSGNELNTSIMFEGGHFEIEVTGTVCGERGDLLITSPCFLKESL